MQTQMQMGMNCGWIKLLNDGSGHNNVQLEVDFQFTALRSTRIYYQSGPDASVNFIVDDTSVTDEGTATQVSSSSLDQTINRERKSDINFNVTTSGSINKADVRIHVVQKKKSFPFGTAVNARKYNANAANGKYRDFIHKHFTWAVPENALKWPSIEPHRGQKNYQPALDMIHGLKNHGLKVRGHNLVWSVPRFVQDWVKALSGDALRTAVKNHIEETMNKTRGLLKVRGHNLVCLEHWDVNNENLHGTWYQDQLHDPDYNLELFRIAHHADPNVKLFLNDYSVVSSGGSTNVSHYKKNKKVTLVVYRELFEDYIAYLAQAQHFKSANVGLYELDVQAADENRRADYYEKALRALYGHPAVEGILFWGFWDQAHWRGEKASLVKGDNLQLTAAGRRVLDLWENQWVTDETHVLSQSGNQFTVRGFHGDYEVHVIYQGHELTNLKKTFTLGKGAHTVNLNVHT
nr:hypothetical protein BaRGS_007051 [Batillaria attramentaria]